MVQFQPHNVQKLFNGRWEKGALLYRPYGEIQNAITYADFPKTIIYLEL